MKPSRGRTKLTLALAAVGAVFAVLALPASAVESPLLVKNISPGSVPSLPLGLAEFGGRLYFGASDGSSGFELWRSDGTLAGTTVVKDIWPGPNGSTPNGDKIVVGSALYFQAQDSTGGIELWKTDGSAAGTVRVKDIRPGSAWSYPQELTNFGGTLLFFADDGTNGIELWKSDGTEAGTQLVKDINPSGNSVIQGCCASLVVMGGTLYFVADDGTSGPELWKSDGTTAGTELVKDINPGSASSLPHVLIDGGGTLYFSATTADSGRELWKSDGTGAGTQRVVDLNSGTGSGVTILLGYVGGTLFFAGNTGSGDTGTELWKSNGTAGGTELVKDINPGAGGSNPSFPGKIGGTLFFFAGDATTGGELWRSDGTEAGTQLVKDINPGPANSVIVQTEVLDVGETLFLRVEDAAHGEELWASDGTEAGTVLVGDIWPGVDDSAPMNFAGVGGTLFFSADDGVSGRELWKVPPSVCNTSWKLPANGFWDEAANWTNGVPDANDGARDRACITTEGAYTVTIRNSAANAAELTVGSGGGSVQTLKIEGNATDGDAKLTLTNQGGQLADGVRSDGVISLESSDACCSATLDVQGGTLKNAGKIQTVAGGHAQRFYNGDLLNTGTVDVDHRLDVGGGDPDWTNSGTIDTTAALNFDGNARTGSFTQTGSSIVNNGSVTLDQTEISYLGGSTTGNPVGVVGSGISPTGGSGSFKLTGDNELTGTVNGNITLAVTGTATDARLYTTVSRTNNGIIELNSEGAGRPELEIQAPAVLTNNHGIITNVGGTNPDRLISGDLTNIATLDLKGTTIVGGTDPAWTNTSNLIIRAGGSLSFDGTDSVDSFTQAAGTISNLGSFTLTDATVTQTGGTLAGTPIHLIDSRISTPGGATTFKLTGTNELTGNVGSGNFLNVTATEDESKLFTTADRTSTGAIILTSEGSAAPTLEMQGTAILTFNPGGTFATTTGGTNPNRIVNGDLVNFGTVNLNSATVIGGGDPDWGNGGSFNIGSGKVVTFDGNLQAGAFTMPAGSLSNGGTFTLTNVGFTFTGGNASGNRINLVDSEMTLTGGSGTIGLSGTSNRLVSDIGSGVGVVVTGTTGSDGKLTVLGSRTNAGGIGLESQPGGGTSTLDIPSPFLLTNTGTIYTLAGGHPERHIDGDLMNKGTLRIQALTIQSASGAAWTNDGTIDLRTSELRLDGGATSSLIQKNGRVLQVSIDSATAFGRLTGNEPLTLDGNLSIVRASAYKPGNGVTFSIASLASRTGTFDKLIKAKIAKTKYFKPVYTATGFDLVVDTATLDATPASGPPGTAVTLTGDGYVPSESLALTFQAKNKAKTNLGSVTTDANGHFSVSKNVPAGAVLGAGKFLAKSGVTGVQTNDTFTVT